MRTRLFVATLAALALVIGCRDESRDPTGLTPPTTPVTSSEAEASRAAEAAALVAGETPTLALINAAPVVNAGGAYTGNEGTPIAFSSAGSIDPEGGTLTYLWEFGDGTRSTAANPSKSFTDNGSYAVKLTATDPLGAKTTGAALATIANVAPTATFTAPASVKEGSAYALKMAGTDAGSADRATLKYAMDCGQGAGFTPFDTVKTTTCPAVRDEATIIVGGKVRDKDGAESRYLDTVAVLNAAPVVTLTATSTMKIPVGGTVSVVGSFTDAGVDDAPWVRVLSWGDGTATVTDTVRRQGDSVPASHRFTRLGTFTVSLRVTDADRSAGLGRITVVVAAAPVVHTAMWLEYSSYTFGSLRDRASTRYTISAYAKPSCDTPGLADATPAGVAYATTDATGYATYTVSTGDIQHVVVTATASDGTVSPVSGCVDLMLGGPQSAVDIQPDVISIGGTSAVTGVWFGSYSFDPTKVHPSLVRLSVFVPPNAMKEIRVTLSNAVYDTFVRDVDGDGILDVGYRFSMADLRAAGVVTTSVFSMSVLFEWQYGSYIAWAYATDPAQPTIVP
jgi:PKD repeat protein